jgi:predicted enzyme related to lactoylglutathione lyase
VPAWDIEGIGRIAMVADPQGAPFYVMRGAVDEASTAFSPDEPGHCGWNELATSDPAAALDFYTSRFGWERGDAMPMGEQGEYRFIHHDGQMIGAVFPTMAGAMPDQPPKWRIYFRVRDVDRAMQAIESGGGTVAMGPHAVPGGDRILIGIDPQGAEFAIVGK